MPGIFDNLKAESAIGPALQGALTNFDTCDVATGYFDLRGWASFADIVDTKAEKRTVSDASTVPVLVGLVMPADSALMLSALQDVVQPPPFGSDMNDMGKALAAKEQLVKHLRTQLMRGLPSEAEQRTLQQLKSHLESGAVERKVFTSGWLFLSGGAHMVLRPWVFQPE